MNHSAIKQCAIKQSRLQTCVLSLLILILSSTCIFIVQQMYATAHSNHFDEFVQLHEIKDTISQNTQTIQEIQSTLELLKNEIIRIALRPPKHLQKPVFQATYSHQAQTRQAQAQQASSPIILAQTTLPQATLPQGTIENSDFFPFPEDALPKQENPFANEKSPDEYWREIQQAAKTRDYLKFNPKTRQAYLKNGATLIRKYETTVTNYFHDAKSNQFKEAMIGGDDGLKAAEAFYNTEKRLDAYISEAKQFRRELDVMLEENQMITLPKNTSYLPVSGGQKEKYHHPRLINKAVVSDGKGNFLIKIGFIYQAESGGIQKTMMNVEDEINIRTMQSINGLYRYPVYFTEEIRNIIRKTYRQRFLKFHYANPQRKDYEQHQFISIIN